MEENNEGSNVINIRPEGAVDVSEEEVENNAVALPGPTFKVIPYDEFLKIDEFIRQRDTEGRAKKTRLKKNLEILLRDHLSVTVGVLLNDCDYDDIKYSEGQQFLIDGHTRRYFWENGKSDTVPKEVYAITWGCSSMEEMVGFYERYDNSTAAEKGNDKLIGAYMYEKMDITNKKLKKTMAIGWAAHYYDKGTFKNGMSLGVKEIGAVVKTFKDQILILDKIVGPKGSLATKSGHPNKWDFHNAILAASLIALKSWNVTMDNNPESNKLVKTLIQINSGNKNDQNVAKMSGVTHVVREFQGQGKTLTKNSANEICFRLNDIKKAISFVLYWIDAEMANKSQTHAVKWEKTINAYKENTKKKLVKKCKIA